MSLEWLNAPVLEIAAAVIEDASGRVLAARRLRGAHLEGLWEFPGGKLHQGETHEAACIRECREELGVEVLVLGLVLPRARNRYPDRTIAISFFRCRLAPGSPAPTALAALEIRWVERARLQELEWPKANRAILHAIATQATQGQDDEQAR